MTITIWNSIRSLGLGLIVMPLQTALMADLPQEEVGGGSAINNIVKMASASLGLAALTAVITNRTVLHSTYLSWTTSGSNLNSLVAGGVMNQQTAHSLLQGSISRMAYVKSMDEMFLIMTFICLLAFFPMFLLKKGDGKQKQASAAAE